MAGTWQDDPAQDALRQQAMDWLNEIRSNADPDPDTIKAFRTWYDADPHHAEVYESVLVNWNLNEEPAKSLTPHATDRLAKYAARRRIRSCLAIAASFVLGLAVVGGIARVWIGSGWSSAAPHERLASNPGDIRLVRLPDGSRVTLDGGSALTVNFTTAERRVTLERGRARFDVAHDHDHPFIVTAGSREVIAHGTVFDIDLRGARLAVSLLRGSIEVRRRSSMSADQQAARPKPGRFLQPGQRMSVERADDDAEPYAVPADESDWTSPMITFNNRPLSEVVASANRYGVNKIVLNEPKVGALRYSGTIRASDTADIARMISVSFGLVMERDQHGTIRLAQRD